MAIDFMEYTTPTERAIARKLVRSIFSVPGRYLAIYDGEETSGVIMNEHFAYGKLASTDSDWIIVYEGGTRIGAICLIWGNDSDLISDYSDNEKIRAIVEPILDED